MGDIVPLFIALADPSTGEVVNDALVTYTLALQLGDGASEIVAFGLLAYDAAAGGYAYSFDTTGLTPGSYDVYIGLGNGQTVQYTIQITE